MNNSRSSTTLIHARVSVVLALIAFYMAVPSSAVRAATYYVEGDNPEAGDSNAGTEAQPWKTISRGTGVLQPGDTLLVKAGTYRETVILTRSGTAAQPITIQAYPGHEGKTVINAAEPVTNWRKCTGPQDCAGNANWSHIYYADVAGFVSAHPDQSFAVRQVFQRGELLPRSRYPDAGWRYPTSVADPKRVFSDSSLAQPEGYFAGAVCHIKTAVWHMDALPITAFSRGTITLAGEPRFDITPRFGYFITNIVGEINAEGEWAYDPAQKKTFVWPRGDVAEDIEFTYRDCCLRTNDGVSFNTVRGLTMRNAWGYGILVFQSHDLIIASNTIEHAFYCGIRLQTEGGTCENNQILRNTVKYSCAFGINVDGAAAHYNIEGNYVYATGVEHFGDDLLNGRGEGVFVWGPYGRVRNNRIDRTAKDALYLGGQPIQREICFNHITNNGLALSDTGGLYTGGYHAGPEKDYIHHNIFADSIGCNTMNKAYEAGLPVTIEKYGGDSPGLYVDEEGNNRIIEYNTVIRSRLAGIYFHWAPTNLVRHNTLYGNGIAQLRLSGKNAERKALVEDVFLDNILFATDAQQKTLYLSMNYNDVHFGQSDRNWFYHPYADTHIHLNRYLTPSSGEHHDFLTLSGWQALSGYDRDSREFSYLSQLPEVTLASPVKSRIVYNASLDVNTVDLGPDLYCDVLGNGIRGKLVLQPFESKILIAAVEAAVSGQATNPVPADGGQVGIAGLVLEWTAAAEAASHNVYLGTDEDAVSAADTAAPLFRGRQSATNFSLQGLVQPGTRYFWRVDEVETDDTTIHAGAVWTFTVADYLLVDDFERYTDRIGGRTAKNESRLEDVWTGGAGNGTGAQVGLRSNPSTAGTDNAHGRKSLSLVYDNTQPPFLSEAEREFSPPQDWTVGAVDTLSLWYRGDLVSFEETAPDSFVMSAAGADIWGARDEFRFAYKQLSGNGSITMRVDSIGNTNVWAKAGPMIRESLETGCKNAYVAVTPGSGVSFQWRATASGASANSQTTGLVAPYWVRITRTGNNFKAERSADGKTWTQQSADAAILMTTNVYIGIAVTSHDASQTTMAEISNVSTTGNATDPWQVADIGVDHPGNSPDDFYVTVEDSEGKTATVIHPDPAAVNTLAWTEWRIPLHNFNGVDLSRVRRMSLGVGGRAAATVKGDGRLCIDDIWVWKP